MAKIDPVPQGSAPPRMRLSRLACVRLTLSCGGKTYVLLPSFEKVKGDKVMYAHASRILHHETNPGCANALFHRRASGNPG